MKLLSLILGIFLFLNLSAQRELKPIQSHSVLVDKDSLSETKKTYTSKVNEDKLAKKNSISTPKTQDAKYYDNYIKALENKRNYILSDSTRTANAKKEGWFEFIELQISTAKEEKLNLTKQ